MILGILDVDRQGKHIFESHCFGESCFSQKIWGILDVDRQGKHILESHCFEESCFSQYIHRSAGGKLYSSSLLATFPRVLKQQLVLGVFTMH